MGDLVMIQRPEGEGEKKHNEIAGKKNGALSAPLN
ncbi:UNVERIFIED_ORG: hypothetical protein M2414_004482 [Rahnella aquatilis]|jgi:hypothetical protein|nr:hypothetical protein [Rahnella aquatilis]RKT89719.1 hypothetical protein BJ925_0156 [Rahnella aquatilis]CAH0223605.1 hypothetical protein SRABI106_02019 [Rahnella aquatilis]